MNHPDIEMRLLGAMIHHVRICDECLDRLSEADFTRPSHQHLRAALKALRAQNVEPEPLVLKAKLESLGTYDAIGGRDFLLAVLERTTNVNAYPSWIETLREASSIRELRASIERAQEGIESGLSSSEIAASLVRDCEGVGGSIGNVIEAGQVKGGKPYVGLSTGVPLIDDELSTRGAPVGQMCVVVAGSGVGKSTMMVQLATHDAWEGRGVLYVTLADLNQEILRSRILRAACGYSLEEAAAANGMVEEFKRAEYELREQVSLGIDDRTSRGSHDVDDILGAVDAWRRKRAGTTRELRSVFIDYAGKLTSRHFGPRDTYQASVYASSKVARYAESSGLVVWVGSQVTPGSDRAGTDDKTKGGNHWVEDSGLTLKIKAGEGDSRTFSLPKSRFGGQYETAPMVFDRHRLTFRVPGHGL